MPEPGRKNDLVAAAMNDLAGDDLWLRALDLPVRYGGKLVLGGTCYVFDDAEPLCGGSAVVFRVLKQGFVGTEDPPRYALKVIVADMNAQPDLKRRWCYERDVLLKLKKGEQGQIRHVPTIDNADEIDGMPAIVMDWIDAPTLADRLSDRDWAPEDNGPFDVHARLMEARSITRELCEALRSIYQHLQDQGQDNPLHGDVKPGNVKIQLNRRRQPDKVWLLDFGESLLWGACGKAGYTPVYASPEQIVRGIGAAGSPRAGEGKVLSTAGGSYRGGGPITWQADQYSVGAVLQEMLVLIRRQADKQDLPLPRDYAKLSCAAGQLTARLPEDRYPSMEAAARAQHKPRRRLTIAGAIGGAGLVFTLVLLSLNTTLFRTVKAVPQDPAPVSRSARVAKWYNLKIKGQLSGAGTNFSGYSVVMTINASGQDTQLQGVIDGNVVELKTTGQLYWSKGDPVKIKAVVRYPLWPNHVILECQGDGDSALHDALGITEPVGTTADPFGGSRRHVAGAEEVWNWTTTLTPDYSH